VRIAQVAPLFQRVPPVQYGGTERVMYNLVEGLVARGHDVTLFASGDAQTSARLVPVVPKPLWFDPSVRDVVAPHFTLHRQVFARAREFDVIHNHNDYYAFPYLRTSPTPVVTTMHGRCDLPELQAVLEVFPEAMLVSISNSQRASFPEGNWVGTVHHGLDLGRYPFNPRGGEGLVFLGRISPEKAPHVAIDVAIEAGLPLTIAARVDPSDRPFFEREVKPRLDHPLVRFVGEVDDAEKVRLLGSSRALLLPLDWPEPFGLVMIEAMACGTPAVVRPCGAAPEIVADGVTGFLASARAQLVAAVRAADRIDRAACRQRVEERFSVRSMVDGYEAIYRRLAAARRLTA
jgi:glycosyltransferase involved in cell wall biosynthesis